MNKVAGFFVVLLAVVGGLVVLYPGAYVCAPPPGFFFNNYLTSVNYAIRCHLTAVPPEGADGCD
jgi:hypothetical protein